MKIYLIYKTVRKKIFRITAFTAFAALLFILPSAGGIYKNIDEKPLETAAVNIPSPDPHPIPVNITGEEAPYISAEGVLVLDLLSDTILYEKNAVDRFNPASTAKIMTSLVGLEYYQLDDILTVGRVEKEGRVMGLISGEKLTFESLLYGTLVHSANDAAYAIAENYPGGVAKFVEAMNQKAVGFGLDNSHFTNPVGFDDIETYTTPIDLAKLSRIALNNKLLAKIVSTKAITVSDVTYTYFHPLTNVNELLGKIAGVSGVKTGYTENGGEILVSEVKKNNHSVLFVVLKSKERFKETETMINWVFNNFAWKNITPVPESPALLRRG